MPADLQTKYPRVEQLGLTIHRDKPGIAGISWDEAKEKLGAVPFAQLCEMMMGQTSGENGWYVYDVESALERIISGHRTGTQLGWD